MAHTCETRLRVRYAETDKMGVVYYANYFVWMEIGRTDYDDEHGPDEDRAIKGLFQKICNQQPLLL